MKTEVNVWENSRADQWKPKTQSWIFTCSRILTNFAESFTRLWRHGENVNFFYKIIIFCLNKEKDDIRSAYVYFNFIHETVNSNNSETEPTILLTSFSCFIVLWKHTCRPIKTHVLSKLFYKINYLFIKKQWPYYKAQGMGGWGGVEMWFISQWGGNWCW